MQRIGGVDCLHLWLAGCLALSMFGGVQTSIQRDSLKDKLKAAEARAEEFKQKTMDQQLELMKFNGMAERCGTEKWYEEEK